LPLPEARNPCDRRQVKVLAIACLLAACSNSNTKKPDASVHFIDAPMADAPADIAIDAAPVVHFGRVEVSQGMSDGSASSGFTAGFTTDEFGPNAATDGPCKIFPTTGTEASFSGGTISVTGTASAITAAPSGTAPSVHYAVTGSVPKPAFTAGSTITISGGGGPDVPAFTGSVVAPAALAGYTVPTTISRAGYTATWTAGTGPTIWVIVAGFDSVGNGAFAICVVDDTGSFTVPASTFAMFPTGANMAFVGVGRVAPMTTTVGGVAVTVQATTYVTSGDITLTQ
jgi:hypothetical protein